MTINQVYSLPVIPYLPLRFRMIAQENTHLPVFKGSLLRGTFGNALRQTIYSGLQRREKSV